MMATVVPLVQGSPEWHAHRARYRNASETPAVLGVSPWQTPYQLWMERSGRAETVTSAAMRRGSQLEPQARAAYERLTDQIMQPLVLVEGEYSASLDGLTLDGSRLVEIKCPAKGRDSSLWKAVEGGEAPQHYTWQIQHQLMVSGAREAHLYVFDGEGGLLLPIQPTPERWSELHQAWDGFMACLRDDCPPELSERDSVTREDSGWLEAAASYLKLKADADAADGRLDEAKARLAALAKHPSESGGGVRVTRFWKQGAVDYRRVPELRGVDLNRYRADGRQELRVTAVK
jgi:putative phage-type endonuclease